MIQISLVDQRPFPQAEGSPAQTRIIGNRTFAQRDIESGMGHFAVTKDNRLREPGLSNQCSRDIHMAGHIDHLGRGPEQNPLSRRKS
jgi:hypothetical protein